MVDIRERLARRAARMAPSPIRELVPLSRLPGMISFGGGYPNPQTFAFASVEVTFKSGTRVMLDGGELDEALQYGASEGLPALRTRLRAWHEHKDGVRLGDDQLVVTNGSQEGLFIAAYLLLDPDDRVVIGEPEYPGALAAFRAFCPGVEVISPFNSTTRPLAPHFARPHPRVFVEILGLATFRYAYLAIFCVFFVFAGFLNVLPFRLRDLAPSLGAGAIGLAYGGYLAGIAVTLGGQALSRRVGSEIRVLGAGIALYAAALGIFADNRAAALYLGMVVFCAGMFLIHGRLSGHLNHLATRSHGIVNGLYITLYYLGGSLGSWVAPLVYRNSDWSSLLLLLGLAVAAAGLSLALMARRGTGREVSP